MHKMIGILAKNIENIINYKIRYFFKKKKVCLNIMNTFSSFTSVAGGFAAVNSNTASTPSTSSYTATGTYTVSQSGSVYTLTFTDNGTLTIVSSNTAIVVLVVGGGGGGGGANQPTTGSHGAAGGGGGGVAYANTETFTSNSLYTITVGSRGSGGTANNGNGGDGGSSSITGTGISMTGSGGDGGGAGTNGNTATDAGIGGTASGGGLNYPGGNGGYTYASDAFSFPGAARSININGVAYYSGGGTSGKINGGSSIPSSGTNVSQAVYGSGGDGGNAATSSNKGANGKAGVVIVKFTLA